MGCSSCGGTPPKPSPLQSLSEIVEVKTTDGKKKKVPSSKVIVIGGKKFIK